jgi:DNA repair exonuclease SbcCD nuclease subunit
MNYNIIEIKATHILMISDIHFGAHVNSEEWQENMKNYFYGFFIPKVKELKASLKDGERMILVNFGDTFNDRKAIDINVYNLAIDIFEDVAKEIETYIINGNHDLAKKTNEGNTSLRAIQYINNVHLITEPTILNINYEGAKHTKIIAIPYLGDHSQETNCLIENNKAKYAFMHTDLAKMRFDNGMLITEGVNTDAFNGVVYSGHIHKRQETKKCIYVGSPYHMDKKDIGNQKGLYLLNLKTNKHEFIENHYSPIYHSLLMEKYVEMSIGERQEFLNNNYNYIIIKEENIPEYKKKFDIYNLGIGTTAKFVKPVINKQTLSVNVDENIEYKEKSTSELINESINDLDVSEEFKLQLIKTSDQYLKDAEAEIAND